MKVEVAKRSGFCFGVKRAVDMALEIRGKSNSIGPLIHNPLVIEELKKKGIVAVNKIDEIDSSTIIVRAHGVTKNVIDELKTRGLKIVDLTCPFVKKVQEYALELEGKGYFIVVIGEKKHPEVEAIVSHLKNVAVIDNIHDIANIGPHDNIGVVVQTTQTVSLFENIVAELRKKYKDVKICNTICNATAERQQEAVELAKRSDIIIVVGGENSANTRRLSELCSAIVETHQIQRADKLKKEWFKGKKSAAVTAGASTPKSMIDEVVERIKNEF